MEVERQLTELARRSSCWKKSRLISSNQVCGRPIVLILTPSTMRYGESCRRGSTTRGRLQMLNSPAHCGRVGTSWSAHFRRRSDGVAKTTASVCCCWRRTVWTWTVTPGATVLLQPCIITLPFNPFTAYNICRDCFQCSLTLSVTYSRCEAL